MRSSLGVINNSFDDLDHLGHYWKFSTRVGNVEARLDRLPINYMLQCLESPDKPSQDGFAYLTRTPEGQIRLELSDITVDTEEDESGMLVKENVSHVEKVGWSEVSIELLQKQTALLYASFHKLLKLQAEPLPTEQTWQRHPLDGTSRVSSGSAVHVARPGRTEVVVHQAENERNGFIVCGLERIVSDACIVSLLSAHLSRLQLKTRSQSQMSLPSHDRMPMQVNQPDKKFALSSSSSTQPQSLLSMLVEHVSFREISAQIHSLMERLVVEDSKFRKEKKKDGPSTVQRLKGRLAVEINSPIPAPASASMTRPQPFAHLCSWTLRHGDVFLLQINLIGNCIDLIRRDQGGGPYQDQWTECENFEHLEYMVERFYASVS
jgi:hypothetical protein